MAAESVILVDAVRLPPDEVNAKPDQMDAAAMQVNVTKTPITIIFMIKSVFSGVRRSDAPPIRLPLPSKW
jgi:hypothetical protein